MLFLQFMLYLSYFVGTLKNEIPEAALELYQLKIKQLSPDILKWWLPAAFCLHFMQARVNCILIILRTQVIKKKRSVRPVFPEYLSVSYDYGWIMIN